MRGNHTLSHLISEAAATKLEGSHLIVPDDELITLNNVAAASSPNRSIDQDHTLSSNHHGVTLSNGSSGSLLATFERYVALPNG